MKHVRTGVALLLALVLALALCACGAKNGKKQSDQPTAQTTFDALCEYAKRLEDAGNYEAAQRVYELLPKAMAGGAINDIEAGIAESTYGDFFAGKQSLNEWKALIESVGDAK